MARTSPVMSGRHRTPSPPSRVASSSTVAIDTLPTLDELIGGAGCNNNQDSSNDGANNNPLAFLGISGDQPQQQQQQQQPGVPNFGDMFGFGTLPESIHPDAMVGTEGEQRNGGDDRPLDVDDDDEGQEEVDGVATFQMGDLEQCLDVMADDGRRREQEPYMQDGSDLLANMTPISGLQNLSESLTVNGVRYHRQQHDHDTGSQGGMACDETKGSSSHPPQQRPQPRKKTPTKAPRLKVVTQARSVSAPGHVRSPEQHRRRRRGSGRSTRHDDAQRQPQTGFRGAVGAADGHRRSQSLHVPRSPVSRSQPIPIPESPVLNGLRRVKSKENFFIDSEGGDVFNLDGGRRPMPRNNHHESFHDFGSSYRDHGQGFAFNMSL